MDRWVGKIAVVTGASSGIGATIVLDLVKAGVRTIGLARRVDRIDELKLQLSEALRNNLYSMKCDITSESEIVAVFREIVLKFGGIDILVNNAGIVKMGLLTAPDNTQMIKDVVNTNVMGLIFCTREAVQSMRARSVDGHVVHINSVVGHKVPFTNPQMANIYFGSKYAVTAITETHRQEFIHYGTKIKVTSLSPDVVESDIMPSDKYPNIIMLKPEDISAGVMYVLGTPSHVQIHELTIKPIGEQF